MHNDRAMAQGAGADAGSAAISRGRAAIVPLSPATGAVRVLVSPNVVAGLMLAVAVVLTGLSLLTQFLSIPEGGDVLDRDGGIVQMFGLDYEHNLPAWYQAGTLMVCGLLLLVIAGSHLRVWDRQWMSWGILGAAFLYLSLDETVQLHERTIEPLRERLGASGVLYQAWVVPAAVLVGAFGIVMIPFVRSLARRTRWRFITAGCLYVGGAMGMELVSGAVATRMGEATIVYGLTTHVEEVLEMLGIVVFLWALLAYIGERGGIAVSAVE